MKSFEQRRNDAKLKIGINRFSKKQKIFVIILLIVMIILAVLISLFLLLRLFLLCALLYIPCFLAVLTIFIIDSKDQKVNLNTHIEEYKKQLNILKEVLKDFGILSNNDLLMLNKKYLKYINEREKEEKVRNKIILTILSALSGVLSISFLNLDTIGIDFESWLFIACILLICVGLVCVIIYCNKYFDSLKNKYRNMTRYLNDIKFGS